MQDFAFIYVKNVSQLCRVDLTYNVHSLDVQDAKMANFHFLHGQRLVWFCGLPEHIVTGLERGEVRLGLHFICDISVRWNVGVEIVAVEAEDLEVGKVSEGGREFPSEVVFVKVESGEGGKCSELSRDRAFEAITG